MALSEDTESNLSLSLADITNEILAESSYDRRRIIGITGPPGASKSLTAAAITREVARRGTIPIAALSMDGFHMRNDKLHALGLEHMKGAPETFEAEQFVRSVQALRADDREVAWPEYSRVLHDPVEATVTITPSIRCIILEGNYLLLDRAPWSRLRELIDSVFYVDAENTTLERRLVDRQLRAGRSRHEAADHISRVDIPNRDLVRAHRHRADRQLAVGTQDPLLAQVSDPATGEAFELDESG